MLGSQSVPFVSNHHNMLFNVNIQKVHVRTHPQAIADDSFFKIILPMHFSDSIATKVKK